MLLCGNSLSYYVTFDIHLRSISLILQPPGTAAESAHRPLRIPPSLDSARIIITIMVSSHDVSRQLSTDALSPGANLAFLQIFMTSAQVEASFLFLFDLKRPEGPGDYGRRYLWAASTSMLRPCYRWKAFCLQILALTPLKAA